MGQDYYRDRIPNTPRFREKDKKKPIGSEPFWPNFLLKEWIVGALFLVAFTLWIIFNPVHLSDVADPNPSGYIPMPDWYFLFLYQLLKYFPGDYVWMGTAVLPGVAATLLLLAPWLDTSKPRHPFKRPVATSAMVLSLLLMIWMTYEADVQHAEQLAHMPKPVDKSGMPADTALVDEADPGATLYGQSCAGCHGADLKGQLGPFLLGIGNKHDAAALEAIITKGFPPNMPANGGLTKPEDVKTVAAWLAKQKQQ